MIFKSLVLYIFIKSSLAIPCERNFMDETLDKKTKVSLQKLLKEGKGEFNSECVLFQPNTTVDFDCERCIFDTRLSRSACIPIDYPRDKVPNTYIEVENKGSKEGIEKLGGKKSGMYERILNRDDIFYLPYSTIFTDFKNYVLREINDKSHTITMDISISLMWMDNHIYSHKPTNIDKQFEEKEGYELYQEAAKSIWKPNLHISNLSDYRSFYDSKHVTSFKILRSNYVDGNFCIRGPMLKQELEAKVSFYCDFDHSNYPLDISYCSLLMGERTSNVVFKWSAEAKKKHLIRNFHISDVIANIEIAEGEKDVSTKREIGLNIKMTRFLKPFILKYYIPCIAIVIMSQLSFFIPLESLPARVGLIVTQFLTLMSLFIQQMNDSPTKGAIDNLGIYLLVSLFFVMATMLQCTIALMTKSFCEKRSLQQQNESRKCRKINVCPNDSEGVHNNTKEPAVNNQIWRNLFSTSYGRNSEGQSNNRSDLDNLKLDKQWFLRYFIPSQNSIEISAFVLFPTFYITFNIIYWTSIMKM